MIDAVYRKTLLAIIIASAITLALAGCGGSKATSQSTPDTHPTVPSSSVSTASAVTDVGGPGPWKVPLTADGKSDFKSWPDPCKMLTLAEIKVIAATTVSVSPVGQTIADSFSQCVYSLATTNSTTDPNVRTTIVLSIENIASASSIKSVWDSGETQAAKQTGTDGYQLYPLQGNANCYWNGQNLECYSGDWAFNLKGQDVTVNSTVQARQNFTSHVLLPVVKLLAPKMQ